MSGRIALFVLDAALDVGAHQGPLTAGAHERDDVLHQRIVGKLARDPINSVGKDTIAKEQRLVRLAQPMQCGARDVATPQANDIDPSKRRDLALRKTERNDVAGDAANASHHNAFADLHELMDRRVAPDEGAAADADVTAEHGVVRKGDVVANVAIMRDVGTDHEEATFADPCNPAADFGADIHGNAFAYLAACSDNELGRFAAIVDRLWRRAERRKRIDDGPFADRRYAGDVNLPDEAHAVFQLDVGTDHTIRADLDAVPNARTVDDARRCINRHVLTNPTATCCRDYRPCASCGRPSAP